MTGGGDAGDPWRAWPALAVLLVTLPALRGSADTDLWWHVRAGLENLEAGRILREDSWSYLHLGAPWVNHEWLPQLVMAGVWTSLGNPGLLVLRAVGLCVLAVAWAAVLRARLDAPRVALTAMALPMMLVLPLANLRPQLITWAGVPVTLWLLDRVHRGRPLARTALLGVILVWVNSHGGFLFGWGLAGLGLLLGVLGLEERGRAPRERIRDGVAAAILLVLPVFNLFGIDLLGFILIELTTAKPATAEWNPPTGALLGVVIVAGALPWLAWAWVRGRIRPTAWGGLAVATVAALGSAKFYVLVLILGTVCLLDALAPRLRPLIDPVVPPRRRAIQVAAVLAVGMALSGVFVSGGWLRVTINGALYPVGAVAFLEARPVPEGGGRLLAPFDWAAPALFHLHPRWSIPYDPRNATVYPHDEVARNMAAWREGTSTWLLRGEPHAALVRTGSPAAEALDKAGWSPAYVDPTASVWVPRGEGPPVEGRSPVSDFP